MFDINGNRDVSRTGGGGRGTGEEREDPNVLSQVCHDEQDVLKESNHRDIHQV